MFKILFLLLMATSFSKASVPIIETSFLVVGKYCANPWDGHEGPFYQGSELVAESIAAKKCYPYQAKRLTAFQYESTSDCRAHYWGSLATATYSCAQPSSHNLPGDRTNEECRSEHGPIKGC